MANRRRVLLTLTLLIAFTATFAGAQSRTSLLEDSYRRARSVLDEARKAHLGTAAFTAIADVSLTVKGQVYNRQQSPLPELSAPTALEGTFDLDVRRNRVAVERRGSFPGGSEGRNRALMAGDQGTNLNLVTHAANVIADTRIPREGTMARVPLVLIQRADERGRTLRWLGEAEFQGRKQNAVGFSSEIGTAYALYFDAQTRLLSKYETLGTDPYLGDVTFELAIKGYTTVAGIPFPTGQITRIGGELAEDVDYSGVKLNAGIPGGAFEPPPGYAVPTPPAPVKLAARELAKDVYIIEGLRPGYICMVAVFNDYVVVLEPVLNDRAAQQVIGKIREIAPNKPIRYVVMTHHHADHIGGIRTFIAEGAALVTTQSNVPYFERMASATFTRPADTLQNRPRKPAFEVIRDHKHVLADGVHSLEVIDIGPSPHAQEMMVVWFPKEKILFEGDLFFRNPDESIMPANPTTLHYVEALKRLALPVERMVGVHARVYTPEDLRAGVALYENGRGTQTAAGTGNTN